MTLVGCQTVNDFNNDLSINEDISHIDVYKWDTDILMTRINDKEFISKLIEQLENTNTYSTADMDYPLPDNKLIFMNHADQVFNMAYYNDIVN